MCEGNKTFRQPCMPPEEEPPPGNTKPFLARGKNKPIKVKDQGQGSPREEKNEKVLLF